jgi:hypothetical protein
MTRAPRRRARGPRLDPTRVAVVRCGDEAVLLDLRTYRATRANPVAARALASLDGTRTAPAIARVLAREFGVPASRTLDDVRRLLAELERRGVLVPLGGRGAR